MFRERAPNIYNLIAAMKIQRAILNKSSNALKQISNPAILFLSIEFLPSSLASARNKLVDKLLKSILVGSRVIQIIHWV